MLKKQFFLKILVIFINAISLDIYAAAAIEKPVVRLGNLKFAPYGAVSYVKELAPSCGIHVEEHIYSSGTEIMAAMAAKEIDVGASTAEVAITGRAYGVPIYVVAGIAKGGVRLVARTGLNIRTLQDLRRRKIGVTRGGAQELFLYTRLNQAGLLNNQILGRDIQIIDMPLSELNQALSDKTIDAMVQSEPDATQAINQGKGFELAKSYRELAIGEPIRVLVMAEKFYEEKHTAAAKFMECFLRAMQVFTDKPDVAQRYIRQIIFQGQLSETDFHDATASFANNVQIDVQQIQTITELMGKYHIGKLPYPSLPKASEWVKTDLLKNVRTNSRGE